jgi:indolepyruvate ferredoxin oxidoreductase
VFTVRMTGIGGTGVVTVSQILGTAAMMAGFQVRGLDQTGLSQKAGPVVSDLRMTRVDTPATNHASAAGLDVVLAFDLLVGAGDRGLEGATADRTVVIASTDAVPTGQMVTHPELALPPGPRMVERVGEVTRAADNRYLDSGLLADHLLGSTTPANVLLLGAAVQAGVLPVPPEHLERAIELNGVAVEKNLAAFRWGRAWAHDAAAVERAADLPAAPPPETLPELIERLADDLVEYQSERYARRFVDVVERVRAAERAVDPASERFTAAVARNLHKLMAYKDEYEVARLLLDDEAGRAYRAVGGDDTRVTYHLHPPMLRALGLDRKLALRRTAGPVLRLLRRSAPVRGTLADPFRWAEVRRVERAMIPEYVRAVDRLARRLSADNLAESTSIAELPDHVRGYEELKLRRAREYRAELARRLR